MHQQTPASSPVSHPAIKTSTAPSTSGRYAHPDMFLEMLQGSAIVVVVGTGPQAPRYTLPVKLLCAHSIYFRVEITRLNSLSTATAANKKRKLSPDGDEKVMKVEADEPKQDFEKTEAVIKLPDVDPMIFGLFLKFIYMGSYPTTVDSRISTMYNPRMTTSTIPTSHSPYASPPASTPDNTDTPQGPLTPPSTTNMLVTPAPSPAPSLQTPSVHDSTIPPSIRAWLLAQRLSATSFMNYATTHIYSAIGTHFFLTPALVDYIWVHTDPSPPLPPISDSSHVSTTTSKPSNSIVSPSPLRKLTLDILVMYWATPSTNIIAKSAPLNASWNALFDAHRDLRQQFITGLQEGGKLMPVQGYFANAVDGRITGGVAIQKVGGDSENVGQGQGV
ncbi:hypothetical protein P153DRAFT_393320 [Dothidotthia symphoricarpi CBS 119687]|uniref:BTB domain-containing protein n=1 Tax=Dothidotthia symphoricarpi CBS 119687 TaxID=1392245 RepID=A0A6A6AND3_9PLEO|nr:uncharacterized protein P153DRAFT_393320 [Dothidotthia symphoricarpi CBS 119687]KAF2133502.1 hypothetical protein P153DRAFT_393320 [Dothidotthia symphoricarpi CBS 119687]